MKRKNINCIEEEEEETCQKNDYVVVRMKFKWVRWKIGFNLILHEGGRECLLKCRWRGTQAFRRVKSS
ncbi:hypothetical protein T05_14296 [Trichinella murrelli]|uniref:Uncharacterized protein n=1 Tax=Trichinella murrelli TaxID=144512 RepID=A0A0V0U3Z6_9BILA|nr:hypothetical protein T05_14296 [Trichinella murrelli]